MSSDICTKEFIVSQTTIGGCRINYARIGQGWPLVLIHGLTNNWEGHIPLAWHLRTKFTVYIPDLPGYGDSGRLASYDIALMSRYMSEFIKAVAGEPAVVAGLSMGSFVTAHLACNHPQAVRKCILIGPVVGDGLNKRQALAAILYICRRLPGGRKLIKKIIETKSHAYLAAILLNMHRFDKGLIDEYGLNGKKKMSTEAYFDMSRAVAEYNLDRTLARIKLPALVVYGLHDKISSPDYFRLNIWPQNQNLKLQVVGGAGHIVSLEKAEEAAQAITKFITKSG